MHPLTPLSRSLQEKRSVLTLLGVHMGGRSSVLTDRRECREMEAKVSPGGGEIDRPQDMATIRHGSPSVHLKPSKSTTGRELDVGWAGSFSQETLKHNS